jgi:hypothetical protein
MGECRGRWVSVAGGFVFAAGRLVKGAQTEVYATGVRPSILFVLNLEKL